MTKQEQNVLRGIQKSLTEIAFYMRMDAKQRYAFDEYTGEYNNRWDKRLIDTLDAIDQEAK